MFLSQSVFKEASLASNFKFCFRCVHIFTSWQNLTFSFSFFSLLILDYYTWDKRLGEIYTKEGTSLLHLINNDNVNIARRNHNNVYLSSPLSNLSGSFYFPFCEITLLKCYCHTPIKHRNKENNKVRRPFAFASFPL